MSPVQLDTLNDLLEAQKFGLQPTLDPRFQRKYQVPGFASHVPSHVAFDARRSFAKFFFYGSKYYAKLAYRDQLVAKIAEAELYRGQSNKVGKIIDFMQDHLANSIDDVKSDWGFAKGAIFTIAMGGSVAAATANATQMIGIAAPYLSDKFGDFRAMPELIKAMGEKMRPRKRDYYLSKENANNGLLGFEDRALGYAIQTGRITETMAPWLASLSHSSGLLNVGGNRLQNGWLWFQEKSALMFETIEQWNRRTVTTAALRLAMKNPQAKIIDEAVNFNQAEYQQLLTNGIGPEGAPKMPVTDQQARAIITANYINEKVNFNYASVFKPRIMRGKWGTVLVFKRYIQSLYYLIGQEGRGFLFRYLIYTMFLGGFMGEPFMEDLAGIMKAGAWWMFGGKNFDLEDQVREWVHNLTNDKIPADLILHGASRRGWGVAALLDMLGSYATGKPGRGLEAPHQDAKGNLIGGYQNVPVPVLDRSRAVSPGALLPVDLGVLFGPPGSEDTNKAIAASAQKASGAAFSVAFNLYKAAMDQSTPYSDLKHWERVMPRALASLSTAFRGFTTGQDTGPGGAASIKYDLHDPEQVAELIAQAIGYQPLRKQAHWDAIMAQSEETKFWEISRKSLMMKYFNAIQDGRPDNLDDARAAIRSFNQEIQRDHPEARGMQITADELHQSIENRAKTKQLRERGIAIKKSEQPIYRHIQSLYPESTINVQRPAGDR